MRRRAVGTSRLCDDAPVEVGDFGSLGFGPGLTTPLEQVEGLLYPGRGDAVGFQGANQTASPQDQVALLLAQRPGLPLRRRRQHDPEPGTLQAAQTSAGYIDWVAARVGRIS